MRATSASIIPRHRVVVVGGGFGGLPATRVLSRRGRRDVEITLIDRRNHHLFPVSYTHLTLPTKA